MVQYIDFLIELRKEELSEVSLELYPDITPKLKEYIDLIDNVQYRDGIIHTFYPQITVILYAYLNFWTQTKDNLLKIEDECNNVTSKAMLLKILDQTLILAEQKYKAFEQDFGSICNESHDKIHEELNAEYLEYVDTLNTMKKQVQKFDRKEHELPFAREHMVKSLRKCHALFDCTHTHISLRCAAFDYQIKQCLEDIFNKVRNNEDFLREHMENETSTLLLELYEMNKEQLGVLRRQTRLSTEAAKIRKRIEKIQFKLRKARDAEAILMVDAELSYWTSRLEEFMVIYDNLKIVRVEIDKVEREISIYNSLRTTEYPGTKACCWENIGETYRRHRRYLDCVYRQISKQLFTFFTTRGHPDNIFNMYTHNFIRDKFDHQVFQYDYALKQFHKTCDGDLVVHPHKDFYHCDEDGRFILDDDGQKVYKCSACRSSYMINEDNAFVRVTEDCGHADNMRKHCKLGTPNPNNIVLLPDSEPIDIKETLSAEVVDYLWKSVSGILSMTLRDVALKQPKNPIHYFAHRLIANKYGKPINELNDQQKEVEVYREDIYKKRKQKALAESLLWKSKQVKKRAPEESDDIQNQMEAYYHTITTYPYHDATQ